MKKTIFLLIYTLLFFGASASVDTLTAPIVNFTGNHMVTEMKIKITNPSDSVIEFQFKDHPQTDSQLLANYVWDKITNPLDSGIATQIEVLKAIAYYIKSPKRFLNKTLIFAPNSWADTLIYQKENSFIGRYYGIPLTQCGSFARQARELAIASGYFKPDQFRALNLSGKWSHFTMETFLGGRWTLTDFDEGQPVFMVANPASPNGWASFDDLHADTALITESSRYSEDGIYLNLKNGLSPYRELMSQDGVVIDSFTHTGTLSLTGTFILPPHAELTLNRNENILFIDTSIEVNRIGAANCIGALQAFMFAASTGDTCEWCLDSFMNALNFIEDDSMRFVFMEQITDKKMPILYNSVQDQGKRLDQIFRYECPWGYVPKIELNTESEDTLFLGKDLKIPLFVLEADSGVCLNDTCITQKSIFPVWQEEEGNSVPNTLSFKEVNYLEEGYVLPGSYSTKLSWNINVLGFFNDWRVQATSPLELERTFVSLETPAVIASLGLKDAYTSTPEKSSITSIRWFNFLGQRIVSLDEYKGMYIVQKVFSDGSTSTRKYMK